MAPGIRIVEIDDEEFEKRPKLTREDVLDRVTNWLERVRDLFESVYTWGIENGWTYDDAGSVTMNEQLMREFGVTERQQPVLRLDSADGRYALFKPKGLWVLGANGRIDLYTSKGVFVIVDEAATFEQPRWMIYRSDNKREGRPFEPSFVDGLS